MRGKFRSQSAEDKLNVVQNLIYFFNEVSTRDYMVKLYAKKLFPRTRCEYMGTLFVREEDDDSHALLVERLENDGSESEMGHMTLDDFMHKRMSKLTRKSRRPNKLFTVAILYKLSAIHFVSFMYNSSARKLITFDPGANLYLNGSRVIIPNVINTFVSLGLIDDTDRVAITGLCGTKHNGRRYGVQYNGEDPRHTSLPADAFCQSWSLLFVIMCIVYDGDHSFVDTWCAIRPAHREAFVTERLFLSHVMTQPVLLERFRKEYGHEYERPIANLYARTLKRHWVSPDLNHKK